MKGNMRKVMQKVIQEVAVPKCLIPSKEGTRLIIAAKPNSKKNKIVEINEEYLGVAIAAPPK